MVNLFLILLKSWTTQVNLTRVVQDFKKNIVQKQSSITWGRRATLTSKPQTIEDDIVQKEAWITWAMRQTQYKNSPQQVEKEAVQQHSGTTWGRFNRSAQQALEDVVQKQTPYERTKRGSPSYSSPDNTQPPNDFNRRVAFPTPPQNRESIPRCPTTCYEKSSLKAHKKWKRWKIWGRLSKFARSDTSP